MAPLRPILKLTDGGIVTQLYRLLGGAPKPLVRRAFQLSSGTKLITKPIAILQHLDDAEWLAQIEAVDRFTANMIAYPGRTLRAALPPDAQAQPADHRQGQPLRSRDRRRGRSPRRCWSSRGNTDGIAPIDAVKPLVRLLPNAHEVRFEIVPGGHLGMLTGRAARGTTWVTMDEWIEQYSTPDARCEDPQEEAAGGQEAARKKPPHPGTGPPAEPTARSRPTGRRSGPTRSGGSPRRRRATWPASLEPASSSDCPGPPVRRAARRLVAAADRGRGGAAARAAWAGASSARRRTTTTSRWATPTRRRPTCR